MKNEIPNTNEKWKRLHWQLIISTLDKREDFFQNIFFWNLFPRKANLSISVVYFYKLSSKNGIEISIANEIVKMLDCLLHFSTFLKKFLTYHVLKHQISEKSNQPRYSGSLGRNEQPPLLWYQLEVKSRFLLDLVAIVGEFIR